MKWILALAFPFLAISCYEEVDPAIPHVDSPVLVSTTPENGSAQVRRGDITISVTYDKNVFFATNRTDQLQFTGGTVVSADVTGSSNTLTVNVNVPTRDTQCTLTIPEGIVTGPNDMPAPAVTVQFSTIGLDESPVDAAAIPEAVSLYNYLLENFETNTLSATMADVDWNTDNAEKVYQWTGKYPAINCFDYMHLNSSPCSWIDYNDIAPVRDWWEKGGIVAAMWHWNVPTADPATATGETTYDFYAENNAFDAANALTEGTWENAVYQADMAEIISYLTLLQNENIPVLWRPYHEAAGGWFWWGKDAASFKALWLDMYNRFQEAGLHNLIWVWTSETGDDDWYPGDQYVDIIGRDLYGNPADDCAAQYSTLANSYGNKMVALSECGYSDATGSTVGAISEQWAAGARWSWIMPWYDNDDATTFHSDAAWWEDAMSQPFVISLDELPGF